VHKYEKLEKIYYKKKFLKILFIILIIAAILGVVFFFKNIQQRDVSHKTSNSIKKTVIKKESNTTFNKNENKKISENKKSEIKKIVEQKDIKNKNIKDIKKEVKHNFSFVLPPIKIDENETKTKIDKKKQLNQIKEINKTSIKKEKESKPKKVLIVEETINIQDLINSFHQNPTYNSAIQIANYYINKNKLDRAKLWALKANNINPSKVESWKIFAIILIKQKNIQKAKEVLKIYLNDYGENPEIKKLLRSINE